MKTLKICVSDRPPMNAVKREETLKYVISMKECLAHTKEDTLDCSFVNIAPKSEDIIPRTVVTEARVIVHSAGYGYPCRRHMEPKA